MEGEDCSVIDWDEAFEERAAIMEYMAGMTREQAEEKAREDLHRCEVQWCIRNFFPDGIAMAAHLDTVQRRRGKPAADRLRVDLRKAWKEQGSKK